MLPIRGPAELRIIGDFESHRHKTTSSDNIEKPKTVSNAFFNKATLEKIEAKTIELNTERKQRRKMKNAFVEFAGHDSISQFNITFDMKVHKGEGLAVCEEPFSAKLLFSVGSEKTLTALNTHTGKIQATHGFKHKLLDCLVYVAAGASDSTVNLAVSDSDKKLHIVTYNTDSNKFAVDYEHQFDDNVHNLVAHPIGSLVFGLKADRSWFVFDLEEVGAAHEKKLVHEKVDKSLKLTVMALHPDGHLLAVADSTGKVHFIDILSNETRMTFDTGYVRARHTGEPGHPPVQRQRLPHGRVLQGLQESRHLGLAAQPPEVRERLRV